MKFELNKKELGNLKKTEESLEYLTGKPDSVLRVFSFAVLPEGTKVIVNMEVTVGEAKTKVTKDITDYENWTKQ